MISLQQEKKTEKITFFHSHQHNPYIFIRYNKVQAMEKNAMLRGRQYFKLFNIFSLLKSVNVVFSLYHILQKNCFILLKNGHYLDIYPFIYISIFFFN